MKWKEKTLILSLLGCLLFGACKKEKEPPVNHLVSNLRACYKFSNDFSDSTGHNGDGKADNKGVSFVHDRNHVPTNALYFAGVGGTVSFNDIDIQTEQVSVSVWVRPDPNSPNSLVYFLRSNNGGGGIGFFQNGPKFGFAVSIPATNNAQDILASDWQNLTGTYDGKVIKLYVDGIFKYATGHPGKIPNISSLVLGGTNIAYWKGELDDLRIYDCVLTDEEITTLAKWK
jgi:hypothetical protein